MHDLGIEWNQGDEDMNRDTQTSDYSPASPGRRTRAPQVRPVPPPRPARKTPGPFRRAWGHIHREYLGEQGGERFILGLIVAVGLLTFFMVMGKAWDLLAEPLTSVIR